MVSPPNKCNCALEIVAMTEFSKKDERKCKNNLILRNFSPRVRRIYNPTNNESLLKFIQMDNASSSIKTANMMQTYVSSRADLKQTWYRPHLLPYLHWCANMLPNVAFTMFPIGLLLRKHVFASHLRRENLI